MIRVHMKRLVRSIYAMRCGYCDVSEDETGAQLTYDHFKPVVKGGTDKRENLVYACHACNEFKGDYWGETDETRLLHPLDDDLSLHLRYEIDGKVSGLTVAGQTYIQVLQINRAPLIRLRKNNLKLEQVGNQVIDIKAESKEILARLQQIESSMKRTGATRRRFVRPNDNGNLLN